MTKTILKNVRIFTGGLDLTGQSNALEWSSEVADADVTTWGSYDAATQRIWREVQGGMASTAVRASGFNEGGAGLVDDVSWLNMGGLSAWSVGPNGANAGDLAYLTQALRGSFTPLGGNIGDVWPWESAVNGSWPMVRGLFLHPPGTPRTATGTGTGFQMPATLAGQAVYANLHVLSATGTTPSITVTVESDSANTFAVTPANRVVFAAKTAIGAESKLSTPGANAHTWYRAKWTISGTTPSFLFVVSAGIGPA